ncbi:hypothetical protein EW146_g5300 [Bondarzewia mesenterica]|uniref:EGF-like domain-containing protein n=1 Tax=Bondarzewia mesenterica TaxID=1095465 RepID=A0A4S4LS05_9AGAM|nr:hypothetical protein EW146_g5300 [Bondarzewia mesenterica]
MLSSVICLSLLIGASVVSSQPSVVCIAGQCLQGFSNTTIGATLIAPGLASDVLLLPGQYTSTTNPELIHQLLTSSSTKATLSAGFNTSISTPFNLALQSGLAIFPESLYSGNSEFAQLPNAHVSNSTNSSTPLSAGALALSSNIWVAVSNGNSNRRVILWDSVPDVSQLPGSPALSLLDIQSNACSPPCSGSGVCSASGQCSCPTGFTGSSLSNPPSSCNCLNGECGSNGQCTCNAGWTTADNATACANSDVRSAKTPAAFVSPASRALRRTPMTGRNATPRNQPHHRVLYALMGVSATGLRARHVHLLVRRAPGPLQMTASFAATGSSMIANNNKHECDSCPAKCTSCKIPNFSVASTVNQLQCSGCLPGFVLSSGKCVASCPSGTFLSPQDNLTCTACSSSCARLGRQMCLLLPDQHIQLFWVLHCLSSRLRNLFWQGFQPVLELFICTTGPNKRALSPYLQQITILRHHFFDVSIVRLELFQLFRSCGSCTAANCNGTSSVVSGLGVCLSDLVIVPQPSGTSSAVPLPTITGLSAPTSTSTSTRPLQWWEILLMALGCAFIFLVILLLWRRRMRKRRAQQTAAFAAAKNLNKRGNWRWRLLRFGERLFGHAPSRRFVAPEQEEVRLTKIPGAEERRHRRQLEKLGGSSALPSYYDYDHVHDRRQSTATESLYSQVTGAPRRTAEPRQPIKDVPPMASRFSWTTSGSSMRSAPSPPAPQTEAQKYAMSVSAPQGTEAGLNRLEPSNTGSSSSRNPFRK